MAKELLELAPPEATVGKKHNHILYLNTDKEVPVAVATFNDGHTHTVRFDPNLDQWVVDPSPIDGHTHQIEEYEPEPIKPDESDADIVGDVVHLFKTSKAIHEDSFNNAEESEDFYEGDQWDNETKKKLDADQRAVLTINKIAPGIDQISGYQREQRTDFKFLPQESGDQTGADILNLVVKNITDKCDYPYEEAEAFVDAAICGVGWLMPTLNREDDIRGKIEIQQLPWDRVYPGPHRRKDLADCEYIDLVTWMSRAKLASLYPDKKDEIKVNWEQIDLAGDSARTSDPHITYDTDQYRQSKNSVPIIDSDLVDIATKDLLVIECWRRIYIDAPVLANPVDDFFFPAFGWKASDIAQVAKLPRFQKFQNKVKKIRITTVACGVLLDDQYPADIAVDDFHMRPIYCYKRGDKFWGKVEAAKDPQREVNKRRSQMLDFCNRMLGAGWFYDGATFESPADEEKFKANAGRSGFHAKVLTTERVPHQVEPPQVPSALGEMVALGDGEVKQAMNIEPPTPGANTSGQAMMQRSKQQLTGNEFFFDNLARAKKSLGGIILKMIQKYYSKERIARLVRGAPGQEDMISMPDGSQKPVTGFTDDAIVSLLETVDFEDYDCIVSESTASPSFRAGVFMVLSQMMGSGAQVPPQMLIEYADMPAGAKKELKQSIMEANNAAAQDKQQTSQMELGKTVIAKASSAQEAMQILQAIGGQGQTPPPPNTPPEIPQQENLPQDTPGQ